jgi:polar amino acid transport system permease protein
MTTGESLTSAPAPDAGADIKAVPVRRPGRIIAAVLIAILAAAAISSIVQNPRFQWGTVGEFLFAPTVVSGALKTLELTAISMVVGIVLGIILAIMRLSPNPLVAGASGFYIWLFRGTPVLVQILFWSFIAALYPDISVGIPFTGVEFFSVKANDIFLPFVAAVLALGLNEGAYMAEIVRAGFVSVDPGQEEAAKALGMRRMQTIRRIILPQAMRVIIPPTGNEVISMLKTTSLVAFVAFPDLLYAVTVIYSQNFKQIPLLIVASIWYLFFTTILSIGQYFIERHYGRGTAAAGPQPLVARVWQLVFSFRHSDVAEGKSGPPATAPGEEPPERHGL